MLSISLRAMHRSREVLSIAFLRLFLYCCLYFTRKILNKNKLRFNIFRFGANYSSSACSLRRVISRIALGSLAGTEKVNSVYSPSTLCTIRSPLC